MHHLAIGGFGGDDARLLEPLVTGADGGAIAPPGAGVDHAVDSAQSHQYRLRVGQTVNLGYVVAMTEQLVAEVIALLVIAPRLDDFLALLGFKHLKLVLVMLSSRQVVQPEREAVRQGAVDGDPASPAA